MTHYTVAIIVPKKLLTDIEGYAVHQMAPFDEAIKVSPYVCDSVEKATADLAASIQRMERIISRQDANYEIDKCIAKLGELRLITPEQYYRDRIKCYEDFNDRGEPISTYNPLSKWDWYVIGGRWDGWINDRETSANAVADNLSTTEEVVVREKVPHAIITPDGQWHERGQMGWWAILLTETPDWDRNALDLFRQYRGHHVVIVDAHI